MFFLLQKSMFLGEEKNLEKVNFDFLSKAALSIIFFTPIFFYLKKHKEISMTDFSYFFFVLLILF